MCLFDKFCRLTNLKFPREWSLSEQLPRIVPALPLGELSGCLGRWAKRAPKIQLCGSGSHERTPKKGMNKMKVNETHDHAVHEKIKVLHYFRFAAEELKFCF